MKRDKDRKLKPLYAKMQRAKEAGDKELEKRAQKEINKILGDRTWSKRND